MDIIQGRNMTYTHDTAAPLLLLLLFIMRSSDPYKARSPLHIELVIG